MPSDPDRSSSSTAVKLLFGVFVATVGVSCFLKLRSVRRTRASGLPANIPTPRPGDILLFHNAKGLNKLITRFTGSPFYHAALYAGDDTVVEARTPGVMWSDLRDRERDFVVAPAPEGRGSEAVSWARTQIGDAYDEMDIAVIILDRLCRSIHFNYTPANKYSCGEFVAVAYDRAGVHLFPKRDLADVVPGDFARLLPPSERTRRLR